MAENELIVTAGLDFETSEGLIIDQLNKIQKEYNNKGGMQINCKISDESLKAIHNSLGNLTQTLNVNVNAQNIQQSINQAVKSEPVKVSVEADIKKGELQKQVNAFVEKFHLTFDKGESGALKAELGEILAKYDQVKKAGNWDEMNRQWDNLTSFVENYATEIDVVSERLREATKQSKLFISESQKSELLTAFGGNKGAVADYLNNVIGRFKWTYNKSSGALGWDTYSTQLNDLIQSGLYNVNANSIDDVAKINTTHIVEGLEQLGSLLNQDKSLANEWYKTYSGDLEALRAMWEGLRQGVVDYLHEIRGEKQSLADMGWEDIGSSESTEKVRNYTQVLQEGLEKIASLKAQIKAEGGDEINSITSRFTSDAAGNVNGFILAVQKSSGEVENLFHKLVEVEDETGKVTREWQRTQITGSDSGIQKAIEQASKAADTLERRLINLKAAADDQSAARPITSEEQVSKVEDAYKKATEAIEKLRSADKSTFSELDNEAKKAVDEFNNVVKAARNADTAATKLRAKPIEIIKSEESAHLNEFVSKLSNSAIPNVENLVNKVAELRNELNQVGSGDKQGLTNYLNNFSVLEEEFKSLNSQAKIVGDNLKQLDKIAGNDKFKKQMVNLDVAQYIDGVKTLREEYDKLSGKISEAKTTEDYQKIGDTLVKLKPRFDEIINGSDQLTISLKNSAEIGKQNADRLASELAIEEERIAKERELATIYWQGKFERSVTDMTAKNTVLEDMKRYYEEMEKDAKAAENLKQKIEELNKSAQTAGRKNSITDTDSLNRINEAYQTALTSAEKLQNAIFPKNDKTNLAELNGEAKEGKASVDDLNKALQQEVENLEAVIKQERDLAAIRQKSNNDAERQILSIEKAYQQAIDPNGSTSIKDAQHLQELEAKYKAVMSAAEALKGANTSTFDSLNNELKTAINNFEIAKSQYRNAENLTTRLKTTTIESVKNEELIKLQELSNSIRNSAIPNVEALTKRVDEFRTTLTEATDKQGLSKYLNDITTFKKEFELLNAVAKNVKGTLKELDSLKTASTYKDTGGKNAMIIRDSLTSLNLSTEISQIKELRAAFDTIFNKIGESTAVKDIQAIEQELANLKDRFDKVVQSTNAETEAAKQMSDALSKIDSAIGKMQNINKQLITGNLTQGEIESKKKDFQNQNLILLQEKERLATAGLLTQQIDKRIKQLGDESNEISRQLATDKQRAEAKQEAEAIAKKEEEDVGKILAIYKEIAAQNKILANPNSTDTQKRQAVEAVDHEREKLEIMTKELGTQTMLNGKRAEAIAQGERLAADAVEIAREQQQAAQAKKDETEAEKAYKKELQDVNKILKDNIAALEKFNNSAVAKNNASNPLVASQTGLNAGYIAQLQGLQESLANDKSSENVQRVKGRIEELSNTLRDARFNSEALQQSLTNASAEATLEAKIKTLTNQMNAFALNNEKAITSLKKMRSFGGETFESQWGKMMTALSAGNLDAEGLKRLTEQFRIFKTEVQGTGQLTTSFADKMAGQLKMLASRWLSLYAVIGKIRTLINYVVELDTAMTKLKRVTDETAEGYERFLETAKKSARETSTTLTDTVEQAARWAKSGYDAATSAKLAKTSLIYSIVGDVDNETAVSDLVTVLRGFNMEAEDSLSIVDKLDALNNKYATDAKSLGEALSVSASAMAAANNDLDQTLALITGASEITQNAKETGQAIRTITMRLRGMKGELEELGEDAEGIESISKVQTQILNLTKGRVNIFDENNNFRSTYDILKEISEVYNELSDPDKANLTEIIFGKLRSNQGLAIINAFQSGQIEKALKDAQNSAGTATEEINKYNESIQAHLNQFKNAAQELSSDAFNTEAIKEVIDDGIKLVSMLDSLTRAVTALGDAIPDTLINLLKSLKDKATLNSAKMLIDLADKVSDAEGEIDNLVNGSQSKESKEKRQKIEEEVSATEKLTQEYLDLMAAEEDIDEISFRLGDNIADLNDQYSTNQEKIDLVNKSLSENIVLMKEAQKQKTGEWLKENAEGYAEAVEALSHVSEIDQLGSALSAKGDAFAIDAKGFGRYTKKQYEAFANLGLSNYVSGEGTGYVHDFALTGTLEEQLDSLKKIRDAYAKLDDMDEKRLTQFDNEISKLQTKIDTYKNLISQFETYTKQYESMQNLSAQEYNMIEQAINAYQAYQKARLSDDSEGEKNALEALNNIKEIVYSISSPSSALRKDFDDMWGKFVLGETEAISKLEELQTDFNKLIDESFAKELKNLDSIEQAIESMMNDETLSHDDAWNIIKLDTDGILKDIKLVNGEYKLSTDELLQLMQQRINKQKEDIKLMKESAEAELANAKARLASIKINSLGDVKAYAGVIEEIKGDIKDSQEIITKTSYLLDELDTKGRKIERIAGDTGKQLNATVKALEAEVEAIDDAIDDLNERKEAIEEEKSLLEDELSILNEQKEALEETLKNYDAVADVVNDYIKEQTDAIQSQIDALEEEQEAIEKFYNDQIDALQKQNEERDDAIKKEKALADLANAENQKKRTYSSARGWTYESSKEDIVQAQNALAEIENDEKIKALEKERDSKLGGFDERKKEYETQIKAFEDYAEKYANVASDIQKAENELLADQILGSEWRTKIEQQDETLLNNYRSEYQRFNTDLQTLVNTEIANLKASIDMKDKEIKKIDDEIDAYNKYKKAVETSLKEAQTELENYKKAVGDAKTAVVNTMSEMADGVDSAENRIWDKHNRIIQWFKEIREAAEELDSTLGVGGAVAGAAGLDYILHHHANGGVVDYTGLAMMHGSKSSSETVFNASQSKKLYDFVRETPNLIASVAKQASQIAGFNPSNIKNNTNNSSISVNIGQVVANNPQELTRNLDTHLDSYFRRKLTQGYTQ